MDDYIGTLTLTEIIISAFAPALLCVFFVRFFFDSEKLFRSKLSNIYELSNDEFKITKNVILNKFTDSIAQNNSKCYIYPAFYISFLNDYISQVSKLISDNSTVIRSIKDNSRSTYGSTIDILKYLIVEQTKMNLNLNLFFVQYLSFNNNSSTTFNVLKIISNNLIVFINTYKIKYYDSEQDVNIRKLNDLRSIINAGKGYFGNINKTFEELNELDLSDICHDLNLNICQTFIYNKNYWMNIFTSYNDNVKSINDRLTRFIIRSDDYALKTDYAFKIRKLRAVKNLDSNVTIVLCNLIFASKVFFSKTYGLDYKYYIIIKEDNYYLYPYKTNNVEMSEIKHLLNFYSITGNSDEMFIEKPALCTHDNNNNYFLNIKGEIKLI